MKLAKMKIPKTLNSANIIMPHVKKSRKEEGLFSPSRPNIFYADINRATIDSALARCGEVKDDTIRAISVGFP